MFNSSEAEILSENVECIPNQFIPFIIDTNYISAADTLTYDLLSSR